MKRLLKFGIMLTLSTLTLHAEVTIPVPPGYTGNDGACLARLYSDVLVPANYGGVGNADSPTQFAQSNAGTLGLTIFFEIRPNSEPNGNPYLAAMAGVGITAVNRFNNTSGFSNRNLTTMKAITKDMSIIWNIRSDQERYNGTADLVSAKSTQLASVLKEAYNSQNCAGLIWSLNMGQSVLTYTQTGYDPGHAIYSTPVVSYFQGTMWFRSSGGSPHSGAYLINSVQIPSCGSIGTMYFWGQNGVTWFPRSW